MNLIMPPETICMYESVYVLFFLFNSATYSHFFFQSTRSFSVISSNFVPTSLPPGTGTISSDLQASFKATLDVMAKLNFRSLSHVKSIEWNLSLSETCLRLSQEMTHVQRQISALHGTNQQDAESCNRDSFAKGILPHIKKHSQKVFSKLVFPSHVEVTTTTPNSLAMYGLTSTCALAQCIFDEIVFTKHEVIVQEDFDAIVKYFQLAR